MNGGIKAALPASADVEVSADVVNGGISSEFPALTVKKDFPLGRHLRGQLGNGNARPKVSSVNGGVKILRGNDSITPATTETGATNSATPMTN